MHFLISAAPSYRSSAARRCGRSRGGRSSARCRSSAFSIQVRPRPPLITPRRSETGSPTPAISRVATSRSSFAGLTGTTAVSRTWRRTWCGDGSLKRLGVSNALTLTQESLLSGHRFELEYILGSFCERTSQKCAHAGLSAKILHNLLSLRSRSLCPRVKRRVYPADCSSPIRYPGIRPWQAGTNALRSTTSARFHHTARRRGGGAAGRSERAAASEARARRARAMRETAGSAAAPAARCKNLRRGSFILNLPLASHHSITASAATRSLSGTVSPSALAAFRFTTSSNLTGC